MSETWYIDRDTWEPVTLEEGAATTDVLEVVQEHPKAPPQIRTFVTEGQHITADQATAANALQSADPVPSYGGSASGGSGGISTSDFRGTFIALNSDGSTIAREWVPKTIAMIGGSGLGVDAPLFNTVFVSMPLTAGTEVRWGAYSNGTVSYAALTVARMADSSGTVLPYFEEVATAARYGGTWDPVDVDFTGQSQSAVNATYWTLTSRGITVVQDGHYWMRALTVWAT